MKKVGITGTIGSGKSFVGTLLRQRGFLVLDADREVHELYRNNQELRVELQEAFGESCLTKDGVNRKFFSDLIFADKNAREQLQNIVYPYLTLSVERFLRGDVPDGLQGEKHFKFVEAALFSEAPDILRMLDEIWIVDAPEDIRLRRLIARGLEAGDACRRIENQRGLCGVYLYPGKVVRLFANGEDKPCIERQLDALL